MLEPEHLKLTRRQVFIVAGIGLAAITERRAWGQTKASSDPAATENAAVFRGPAKEIGLELSDQEGGHVPKQVVRSNAPNGRKTIAWHFESPLRNGEAQLDRATLTAFDDGRFVFTAVASSKLADDHWNVFFAIRSKSNPKKSLVVLPKQPVTQQLSPDGVPLYTWLQFPVSRKPVEIVYEFPRVYPSAFADLGDVILACDC